MWIACSPVDEIQIGVVRARHPSRPTPMSEGVFVGPCLRSRSASFRKTVPTPDHVAVFGIQRFQKMRDVRLITGCANDDAAFHDQRSKADVIAELDVSDFDIPDLLTVTSVQADYVRIRRAEIKPVLVHSDSTMADVIALRRTVKVPDGTTGARVDSPDVVRSCEVQDAMYFEGR